MLLYSAILPLTYMYTMCSWWHGWGEFDNTRPIYWLKAQVEYTRDDYNDDDDNNIENVDVDDNEDVGRFYL